MPVEWSEQALEDVEDIRTFIARDSLRYAELVVDRIFEAVERLEAYPLSGRIVPEFRDPALRVAPARAKYLTAFHDILLAPRPNWPGVSASHENGHA